MKLSIWCIVLAASIASELLGHRGLGEWLSGVSVGLPIGSILGRKELMDWINAGVEK